MTDEFSGTFALEFSCINRLFCHDTRRRRQTCQGCLDLLDCICVVGVDEERPDTGVELIGNRAIV